MKSCIKLSYYIKKSDIILCIALLFLAISGIFLPLLTAKSGATLLVRKDGVVYTEVPLSEDTIIMIKEGDTLQNSVGIVNGYAAMIHATCVNQLCVQQRAISSTHETIVCLPNKIILEIIHDADQQIDAISK